MDKETPSQGTVFLTTVPPGPTERRIAFILVVISAVLFLIAVPFAKEPLARLQSFIPMYEAALVVSDLITATLLFVQFSILRTRAMLALASGYLFTAFIEVAHLMSFPGAFAPGGLLGSGPQTTAWLYMFWHGIFPLFVIAYVVLGREERNNLTPRSRTGSAILGAIASTFGLTVLLTLSVTAAHDAFPPLMVGNQMGPNMLTTVGSVWLMSLAALGFLWPVRNRSMLDLWLVAVMFAWLFDIALSAVLNGGRFDLGFYAGRVYGLLAANFVLVVLLLDNGKLHARLIEAHRRERHKTDSLARIGRRLEATNAALAEKSHQLQKASQMKSDFLASMSHELRTPLNAIIGFSEVLKDGLVGELRPEQREYVTDIYGSGQHLLSLINDILDLSKIEAGKMSLDLEPVDIEPLLRNGLSVVREKAANGRIELSLDLPDPLGSFIADARKTKQIVYNLLSNAVKFTPQGGRVSVSARAVDRSAIEHWASGAPTGMRMPLPPGEFDEFIEFSVRDTGPGIAPEDAGRLFQAFSQLDSSLDRAAEGSGLGLTLTLKLAVLHGGTVALSSTPGQGSCFTAWLPRRASDAATVAPAAARKVATRGARQFALVIEDNDRAAELISLQLKPNALEVMRAHTARQALDLLATVQPQVIILDILLPDMDGWDLLALIKHPSSPSAGIPVVIVSVVADAQKGFALGASQVLQKPVSRDELLLTLDKLGMKGQDTPISVLVADDDPIAVELATTYLIDSGYKVLRALGGAEAVDICRRELPDLIVLDLVMPGVNGFDVIEILKADPITARIPIVVLTAKSLTAEDRAALLGYIDAILDKGDMQHTRFDVEVRRALEARKIEAAT